MAFTRPTVIPRWTFLNDGNGTPNDVLNVTSGKYNVATPSSAKQTLGFDLKEFPPRQDFNWIQRYNGLWIAWLDQREQALTLLTGQHTTELAGLRKIPNIGAVTGLQLSTDNAFKLAVNAGGTGYVNVGGIGTVIQLPGPSTGNYYFKHISGLGYVFGATGNPIPSTMPTPADGAFLHVFIFRRNSDGLVDIALDDNETGTHIYGCPEITTVYSDSVQRIGSVKINSWASKTFHQQYWRDGSSLYNNPHVITITEFDFDAGPSPFNAFVPGLQDYAPFLINDPFSCSPIISIGAPSAGPCKGTAYFSGALSSSSDLYNNGVYNIGNDGAAAAWGAPRISEPLTSGGTVHIITDLKPVSFSIKILVHGWKESSAYIR